MNFERHKAYEVERGGTNPYRGKADSDRTKPQVESGQSTAFLSVVDCTHREERRLVRNSEREADETSLQNRHRR